MPTFEALGKKYGARIADAVARDQSRQTKGLIKEATDLASSNLGTELITIGQAFARLTHQGTHKHLTEADEERLAAEIAKEIGWNRPKTLRRLIKGGSVDALMAMAQQMEALFAAVKK
jgi:hypothetical protein